MKRNDVNQRRGSLGRIGVRRQLHFLPGQCNRMELYLRPEQPRRPCFDLPIDPNRAPQLSHACVAHEAGTE